MAGHLDHIEEQGHSIQHWDHADGDLGIEMTTAWADDMVMKRWESRVDGR